MKFTPVDLAAFPRGQMLPTDYYAVLMPLSLTCHHAATDGYHVSVFLESLAADMNDFGRYL